MKKKGVGSLIAEQSSAAFVAKTVELIILVAAALMVFPLFPIMAIVIAFAIVIALITRLRRPFSWRFVLVVIGFLLAVSAITIVVLLSSDRTKFVVTTNDLVGVALIEEVPGPAGSFWIVPVSPLKSWLFEALARRYETFVILDATRTPTGFTIISPAELALARLSSPDGVARRRMIAIPFRKRERLMLFRETQPGTAEFSLSVGLRNGSLYLPTDVGPHAPGLFGLHSNVAPSNEIWRRVAFGDELIRNLSRLEVDQVLARLEEEATRTGEVRDLLRLLVFRMQLVAETYTSPLTAGRISVFGLSSIGNLRWIAEHAPDAAALDNGWGWALQVSALGHLNVGAVEARPFAPPVDTGERWLVGTLTQASERLRRAGLGQPPSEGVQRSIDAERHATQALEQILMRAPDNAVTPEAMRQAMVQMSEAVRADEDPLAEGDFARLQVLRRTGPDLLRPEVRQWIRAVPERAPSRGFLVYSAIRDRCGEPLMRIFDEPLDREILRRLTARMQESCAPLSSAVELFEEPLQRRMVANDAAIIQPLVSFFLSGQDPTNCANGSDQNAEGRCFAAYILLMAQDYAPFLRPILDGMVSGCGTRCGGVALYERRLPIMGPPYSAQEFFYGLHLLWALADDTRPELSPTLCRGVEGDFADVMAEGRILDRVVALNLHRAVFRRCSSPSVALVDRVLANHRLPVAAWQRFVEREFMFGAPYRAN